MNNEFNIDNLYNDLIEYRNLKELLKLKIFPQFTESTNIQLNNYQLAIYENEFHTELQKSPIKQIINNYISWAIENEENEFIFRKAYVKVFWNLDIRKEDTVII